MRREGAERETEEEPINAVGISSIEESEQILVSESLGREEEAERERGGSGSVKREEGEEPINAVGISSIEESEQILVSESLGREEEADKRQ
jgi:hypothetical protein